MGYGQYSADGRPDRYWEKREFENAMAHRQRNADAAKRVANNRIDLHVSSRRAFSNAKHSCYAMWTNDYTYAVYSYGEHFPMYVWSELSGTWYGNSDRFSITTTNHQRCARPSGQIEWRGTDRMQELACLGDVGFITKQIEHAIGRAA